MMQRSNQVTSLGEAEFNNLCSHYKDTYEIHLSTIKQRDTLFYALLVILALFSLQISSTELVNSALSGYVNKQLDITIEKNSNLFGTLLWLLLFGFSTRYYQTVIQIERQYNYIHHLEEIISGRFTGTRAFTREGKSYLGEYPLFSNWMWLLYTLAFPFIILLCIFFRIQFEVENHEKLGVALILGFISFFLVVISTILYIDKLHGSRPRKLLTITFAALEKTIRRIARHISNRFQ
jgi:hypothetical protein